MTAALIIIAAIVVVGASRLAHHQQQFLPYRSGQFDAAQLKAAGPRSHIVLIIIAAIVVVGALCLLYELYCRRSGKASAPPAQDVPEVCCGQHAVCERDSLLAAVDSEIEYFDDEELDCYAAETAETGMRDASGYSHEATRDDVAAHNGRRYAYKHHARKSIPKKCIIKIFHHKITLRNMPKSISKSMF